MSEQERTSETNVATPDGQTANTTEKKQIKRDSAGNVIQDTQTTTEIK